MLFIIPMYNWQRHCPAVDTTTRSSRFRLALRARAIDGHRTERASAPTCRSARPTSEHAAQTDAEAASWTREIEKLLLVLFPPSFARCHHTGQMAPNVNWVVC